MDLLDCKPIVELSGDEFLPEEEKTLLEDAASNLVHGTKLRLHFSQGEIAKVLQNYVCEKTIRNF